MNANTARPVIWIVLFTIVVVLATANVIASWWLAPLAAAVIATVLYVLVGGYILADWLASRRSC